MSFKNKRVVPMPYDQNRHPLSAMIAAVMSGGEIVDYLPVKAVDNGDGTATLSSTVNVTFDADVDIGNLHLLNTADAKINPATEEKQDAIIAIDFATETTLAAAAASLVAIDTDLDVVLSTRASEVTLVSLEAKDFATETTQALLATEVTLAAIKAKTDGLTFDGDDLKVTSEEGTGVREPVVNAALSAGANTLSTTAVSAGKIQKITRVTFSYTGTVAGVRLEIQSGGVTVLKTSADPVSGDVESEPVELWINATENIDLLVTGATVTDTATLTVHGLEKNV